MEPSPRVTAESIAHVPIAFATPSLGMHPTHTLERKFMAMQEAGFNATVLGFGEYMAWVRQREPDL